MVYVRTDMDLLIERCMSTSVSVMRPGYTMTRLLREHFFRTSTSRYVRSNIFFHTVVCIHHVYGCGNRWIVYSLAESSMKFVLKLKMLQYCSLFN